MLHDLYQMEIYSNADGWFTTHATIAISNSIEPSQAAYYINELLGAWDKTAQVYYIYEADLNLDNVLISKVNLKIKQDIEILSVIETYTGV